MSGKRATILSVSEPSPCLSCELWSECGSRALACEAFRHFVATGRTGHTDRQPTRATYRAVFPGADPRRGFAAVSRFVEEGL
jgi:hypothetical protein